MTVSTVPCVICTHTDHIMGSAQGWRGDYCTVCHAYCRPGVAPPPASPAAPPSISDPTFQAWTMTPCASTGCAGERWHHIANQQLAQTGQDWRWSGVCSEFVEPRQEPPQEPTAPVPVAPRPPGPQYPLGALSDQTQTAREAAIAVQEPIR